MLKIFKFVRSKALLFGIISILFTTCGCVCDLFQPQMLTKVINQVFTIEMGKYDPTIAVDAA
ncbi:MAG: hypothetical protein K2M43_00065 [Mycoplasmoidaceae bacterium]|nr:hypothetical protein [Mycoplasmoidaceae bacterium]